MKKIDEILNNITMYRLVVYILAALSAIAILFAFLGIYSGIPKYMIVSLIVLLVSAYITNRIFSWLFRVPSNMESWLITSLILFLIIPAGITLPAILSLGLAAGISSASKFLLARNGKHFFNPAALAASFLSIWGFWPTTWWIGSSMFWPFTLLFGLIVVRKIRRFPLVATFLGVSIILQAALFIHDHQPLLANMKHALIASPLIFLATIMLTEPATMPPRRNLQIVFAAIVATLYVTGWKIGPLVIYPEVALLIGNIFAYIVSPKFRVRLRLKEIQKISDRVYNYIFMPDIPFKFSPGQYMEWTLAGVPYDNRGNRRTFTIASSPTEKEIHLGLKFYEPASNYKAKLAELKAEDVIYGSQLAGNFTLKGNQKKKLAFIAGGIGITPFRSMVKYLSDTNTQCDVILVYLVSDPSEFAYINEFKKANKIGIRTIPIITNPQKQAPGATNATLTPTLLSRAVPDYGERVFYVSGPNTLVETAKQDLQSIGVARHNIKTDHFSGY